MTDLHVSPDMVPSTADTGYYCLTELTNTAVSTLHTQHTSGYVMLIALHHRGNSSNSVLSNCA